MRKFLSQSVLVAAVAALAVAAAGCSQYNGLKAKRTWRFSGWVPGKPLYGHYRHEGRTYDNVRFGVPTGPCGYLKTKKPLLSVKTKRPGTWTVWVDQSKTYKNENPLSLYNTFSVIRTYF